MEKTLNVKYATIGKDYELRENINITIDVEKGLIVNIGISQRGFTEKPLNISAIAIPSPINAHIHSADFIFSCSGLKLSIEELVKPPHGLKHKLLRKAHTKELEKSITQTLKYLISTGVSTAADFREGGIKGVKLASKSAKKTKFRLITLGRPLKKYNMEKLKKLIKEAHGIGLSSTLSFKPNYLSVISKLVKGEDKLLAAHVSETKSSFEKGDFEYTLKHYKPSFIVHGTYLRRREFEILAEKKIPLVMCPRANTFFSVGVPQIAEAIKSGTTISLGTDNAGWILPNIWRELEYAFNLTRLQDRNIAEPKIFFKMITYNAAKTLSLEREGVIDEGMKANITLLKLSPNIVLTKNILASIILRTDRRDVLEVLLEGKPLIKTKLKW